MTVRTKTVVMIESHQQTIVRRSQRTSTAELEIFAPEIIVPEKNRSPRQWWKTVALKGAGVLAPWSQRLKTRAKKNK